MGDDLLGVLGDQVNIGNRSRSLSGVLSGCDGGTKPVAYLGIHGVSDGTLNISGGRSMRDKFVMNNGCTSQSPPEPKAGSGMHTCTPYQGCKSGYPVEWCAFDGGDGAKT